MNSPGQGKIQRLEIRSRIIQAVRDYFCSKGFLEVETPIRCPAVIPEAQIDPVTSDGQYLQASPELSMKRLLSQGFEKIFQICKTFRKNERGSFHLPEFTLLEWYETGSSYLDLMDHCKALICFIAEQLNCGTRLSCQGKSIDLAAPWQTLTVKKAFKRFSDTPIETALDQNRFDEIISFQIEPCLGIKTPAFLMDYPACMASLAQLKPDDPKFSQRLEFYMAGIELANGFTELTDPVEQHRRFKKENLIRQAMGKSSLPLPSQFLKDIKNMPPAAGMALGVDRLVMIFCDAKSIDDVVAFVPETL